MGVARKAAICLECGGDTWMADHKKGCRFYKEQCDGCGNWFLPTHLVIKGYIGLVGLGSPSFKHCKECDRG